MRKQEDHERFAWKTAPAREKEDAESITTIFQDKTTHPLVFVEKLASLLENNQPFLSLPNPDIPTKPQAPFPVCKRR